MGGFEGSFLLCWVPGPLCAPATPASQWKKNVLCCRFRAPFDSNFGQSTLGRRGACPERGVCLLVEVLADHPLLQTAQDQRQAAP